MYLSLYIMWLCWAALLTHSAQLIVALSYTCHMQHGHIVCIDTTLACDRRTDCAAMDELIEMLFGWQTCVNPALLVVFTGVDIPPVEGNISPWGGALWRVTSAHPQGVCKGVCCSDGALSQVNLHVHCVNLFRYFVSKGAIVDKIGGDLKSTPLHWATRLQLELYANTHVLLLVINFVFCQFLLSFCYLCRFCDYVIHLCSETETCFSVKLKPVSDHAGSIGFHQMALDASSLCMCVS